MDPNTFLAVVTIVAILVGPIAAVLITRYFDGRRERHQRQWLVFRDLMRTRRMRTSPDFVGAVNLAEVEFAQHPEVIKLSRAYLDLFNRRIPTDEQEWPRFQAEADTILTRLLDAMAKCLGVPMEQVSIMSGGYAPRVWFDTEDEQRKLRLLLSETLTGNLPITVRIMSPDKGDGDNVVQARRPDPRS